jgi:hypothetical protein
MLTYRLKPAELVDKPPDGSAFAQRIPAPTNVDFRLGEIVRIASGQAAKLTGSETTDFHLVVKDNTPGLPEGSFVDNPDGTWFARRPNFIDVIPVSGRRVILNAQGTLAATHIGAQRPLSTTTDGITVVNLGGTGTAARILQVVEGRVGDTNARVLVELA